MINLKELLSSEEDNIWRRNLVILCVAQFIALIGMSGVFPFLPLYVRELGITDPDEAQFWSGMIFAGVYISAVIMIPIWGSLGDKYGRKFMTVRAIFGLALSVVLMAFAQDVYQLFFLRVLQGTMSGMIASSLSFVSANTPENKSGYAIGWLQSAIAAGQVFGPFFGGLMADFVGIRYVFVVVGVLCAIAAVLVLVFLQEKEFVPRKDKVYGIIWNIKFIFRDKVFLRLMTLIVLIQMGVQFTIPIFTYFVETKGAPDDLLATVTGVFSYSSLTTMSPLLVFMFAYKPSAKSIPDLQLVNIAVIAKSIKIDFLILEYLIDFNFEYYLYFFRFLRLISWLLKAH